MSCPYLKDIYTCQECCCGIKEMQKDNTYNYS